MVDAKSGGWGFSDLFKVFGWRTYLGIPVGVIVHSKDLDAVRLKAMASISDATSTLHFKLDPNNPDFDLIGSVNDVDNKMRGLVASNNWYYQIALREAFKEFRPRCKTHSGNDIFDSAYSYQFGRKLRSRNQDIR